MLLACSAICLGVFDIWFTHRRVKKYGVGVELNPLSKSLMQKLGILNGLSISAIPAIAIPVLLSVFNLPLWLAFYVGLRVQLFTHQILSLGIEKEIDRKRKPGS